MSQLTDQTTTSAFEPIKILSHFLFWSYSETTFNFRLSNAVKTFEDIPFTTKEKELG